MGTNSKWHSTGSNGPASAVWVRKRAGKSVVISVHKFNVTVDHWEKTSPERATCDGFERTLEGVFWHDLASAKKAADVWLGVPPRKSRAGLKKFSVVGFYDDNRQPFVSWERAEGPLDAAEKARNKRANSEIKVVEVFHGHIKGILTNEEVC